MMLASMMQERVLLCFFKKIRWWSISTAQEELKVGEDRSLISNSIIKCFFLICLFLVSPAASKV